MKDIEKGSKAIAAVVCRVIDYYIAKQSLAVAEENGFDDSTVEHNDLILLCDVAETRIADAVANIAVQVQ